jgi:hypothetical protein
MLVFLSRINDVLRSNGVDSESTMRDIYNTHDIGEQRSALEQMFILVVLVFCPANTVM